MGNRYFWLAVLLTAVVAAYGLVLSSMASGALR